MVAAVATDTVAAKLPVRVVSRRIFFRATIRIRIFVLRTQIIPANTAGTATMLVRTGIGKGRVVVAMVIVVKSVPIF